MNNVRLELMNSCKKYVEQRIQRISIAMEQLKEDLENESKSSAGDKYETGREMINIEWNKLHVQLREYERLDHILARLPKEKINEKIGVGSIVYTSAANYFISIPAGEMEVEGEKFYAIGVQAPVAQQLLGLKEQEEFELNGKKIHIQKVR
ncbi:transcription elongation factor [Gramella sp. GC03-9]|uniref:Transcription elongation factor n=1 Tax=Christiangramia oceanisediminis TaxID=2920386 RepID=A0A9X2KXD0_9FLAO|nr:transcription elongation factor [Gramella oceanisediminis]MCP9199231.1 transcription elongation factor [Gramella oceanisediminis]